MSIWNCIQMCGSHSPEVTRLKPGSSAESSGLRRGDRLVTVNEVMCSNADPCNVVQCRVCRCSAAVYIAVPSSVVQCWGIHSSAVLCLVLQFSAVGYIAVPCIAVQ